MGGATRECRIIHGFCSILSKNDGNRRQSHKRSISIVEPISFLAIILSSVHELLHGYLDISAEADGVLPAAVVEPVEEP